jgi:DNA-binding MarR family transcriptional regulator
VKTNLARLLLDAFRWLDDQLLAELRSQLGVELTSAQSLLFAALPAEGAVQADLARSIGVSRQAINELVKGLVRQDLVELVADPDSARSKLVRPTAKGRASIAIALETLSDLENRLRERIGHSEVDALRAALESDWGSSAISPHSRR